MKKLMIAAAIVCAAALSQAATFSWSMTDVVATPDAKPAAVNWAVYYLDASKYAGMATAEDIAAYVTSNYKYDAVTAAGRGGAVGVDSGAKGSYSQGQSESGFMVIFDNAVAADADYYAMTAVQNSNVVTAQGNDINIAFGTFSTATTGWQSIPEPTSGLLLLIGVAGLALRRRRA